MEGQLILVGIFHYSRIDHSYFVFFLGSFFLNKECCLAYNDGSSEPLKLSQNDFEHYKVVFMDILASSNQLKLETKPIGEGKSCCGTSVYHLCHYLPFVTCANYINHIIKFYIFCTFFE